MRDKRFVAQHRGGLLTREDHFQLIKWASACSEHVLPLIEGYVDKRLMDALHIAEKWGNDNATVGEAMKASLSAHAVARESSDPVSTAVARSIGQAVATAHMADHSLGGALYALKAIKLAGRSISEEREWQNNQLQKMSPEIVELVLITLMKKEPGFKL